jgi:hypothetical protein
VARAAAPPVVDLGIGPGNFNSLTFGRQPQPSIRSGSRERHAIPPATSAAFQRGVILGATPTSRQMTSVPGPEPAWWRRLPRTRRRVPTDAARGVPGAQRPSSTRTKNGSQLRKASRRRSWLRLGFRVGVVGMLLLLAHGAARFSVSRRFGLSIVAPQYVGNRR